LSPLSEVTQVSEVSADDDDAPGTIPGLGVIPGFPGFGAPAGAPAEEKNEEPEPPPKPIIIQVQAELVGMLIGKGGEVVKQLSKESGARIEISKSGTETNGERTVYLSGQAENVERAKQLIDDTLSKAREKSGMNNPNAHVMKVPHEMVGMLIGKGGETIKKLKRESGARIDISKEPTEGTNINDRLVHISGPPECVEYARRMVDDMLGREAGSGGIVSITDKTPTSCIIKVAHELIGMLIGKAGETIKTISKDSGTRIEIAKDEDAEREEARSVHISGPPECIAKAKLLIEDTLSKARERQGEEKRSERAGEKARLRDIGMSGSGQVLQREISQDFIGMLIGKGGSKLKTICVDSGARIEITKNQYDITSRTVTLSGAPECIDKARTAIEEIIGEAEAKGKGKGFGKGWPEFWPPPPKMPPFMEGQMPPPPFGMEGPPGSMPPPPMMPMPGMPPYFPPPPQVGPPPPMAPPPQDEDRPVSPPPRKRHRRRRREKSRDKSREKSREKSPG